MFIGAFVNALSEYGDIREDLRGDDKDIARRNYDRTLLMGTQDTYPSFWAQSSMELTISAISGWSANE